MKAAVEQQEYFGFLFQMVVVLKCVTAEKVVVGVAEAPAANLVVSTVGKVQRTRCLHPSILDRTVVNC
jgi:hypothetical protein